VGWRTFARFVAIAFRDPLEALDRVRIKHSSRTQADRPHHYEPVSEWRPALHNLLGVSWPCSCVESFSNLWDRLCSELALLGLGHDADPRLAEAIWSVAAHLSPEVVVETGVARGVTSRVVLESFAENGSGRLWSIDLPPLTEPWWSASRSAVPEELRGHWSYIRKDARRVLPRLIAHCAPLDLFIHDSLHTEDHMRFEFRYAERSLRVGGVLVADDIDENAAFASLLKSGGWNGLVVGHQDRGAFGVAVKI
jgi:hypothetical protein